VQKPLFPQRISTPLYLKKLLHQFFRKNHFPIERMMPIVRNNEHGQSEKPTRQNADSLYHC
jgi:hypothetical protein